MGPERRRFKPPVETKKSGIEVSETLEARGRRVFDQAVVAWLARLTRGERGVEKLQKPLPRSLELGAALVPTLLFTALQGCTDLKAVACTADEEEYLDVASAWMIEHPEQIQQQMDIFWPDQTITAKQLISTVNKANVECGISTGSSELGGEAWLAVNTIVVNVDEERFDSALANYQEGKWIEDYSLSTLVEAYEEARETDNPQESADLLAGVFSYYSAMSYSANVLGHEAAHLALGVGHEPLPQATADLYGTMGTTDDHMAHIDEMYAWGEASEAAAMDVMDRF